MKRAPPSAQLSCRCGNLPQVRGPKTPQPHVHTHLQVSWLQPEVQLDAVGHLPECRQCIHLCLGQGRHALIATGCFSQLIIGIVEGD